MWSDTTDVASRRLACILRKSSKLRPDTQTGPALSGRSPSDPSVAGNSLLHVIRGVGVLSHSPFTTQQALNFIARRGRRALAKQLGNGNDSLVEPEHDLSWMERPKHLPD